MLNNRLNVHVSHTCFVQLSLHQLIIKAKNIVSLKLSRNLLLKALPSISQLPAKILILLYLFQQGLLNEFVLVS